MNLRTAALWTLLLGCVANTAAAADPLPDPDQVEIWRKVKAALFGDREIRVNGEPFVTLRAPARAQDAATVPVAISIGGTQTPQRYVSKLYLLIDKNPSPIAAVFSFSSESGRADIETRVRVEDYTWMRAIAETSDGQLYMATRYVKAAGGCSSPTGTAPDFENFKVKARMRLDASVVADEPNLVQLMIQHPNSSGLAKDQLTQLYIPAYYVRTVTVTYAGKPIMNADVDFSISENPNFRFYFVPREAGELKATVVDTKDREIDATVRVELDERS